MIGPQLGVARTEISLRAHSRALLFLLAVGCASLFVAAETSLVGITSSFETPGGSLAPGVGGRRSSASGPARASL